ncbi:binding--dependent transport system inner membrane component family protein, partial [Vibrio harveyi]
LSTRYYC